ncbi:MAG: ATP-binding cassette domain-containing protein [Anaplasmataceae bacterium]|nr:ATP-binding cassette domain-containing protein [Anaplasmataceae bacterium]
MIYLEKINLIKQKNNILDDISITFQEKQITSIIGPNGGGKSSLLKIIMSLIKPNSGTVIFSRKDINISYMPQKLTMQSNFMPISVSDFLNIYTNKIDCNDIINLLPPKVYSFFFEYGQDKQINTLSHGQFQFLLLLRCLMRKADLFILDEPESFLDIKHKNIVAQLFNHLKNIGKTIIIASHDLYVIAKYTDNVICLNKKIHCKNISKNKQDIKKINDDFILFDHDYHE